jgi:hypothetical protein
MAPAGSGAATHAMVEAEELCRGGEASSDEEEDTICHLAVAFRWKMAMLSVVDIRRGPGGSLPGKAPNVQHDFGAIHAHYMEKYFWPVEMLRLNTTMCGPRQPERAFERRFRMPRLVFDTVLTKFVAASEYFRRGLRPDATGRAGITPLIKVIVALRQLAYGIPSDLCDDMFDVSETTAAECMYEFCFQVVSCFGNKYLREPTTDNLKQI